MRIFAVGDIHGMYKHMCNAVNFIENEMNEDDQVVFLGDYVDRGPDSALCLLTVKDLNKRENWHFLRGNHEDMMINPEFHNMWIYNGGRASIHSIESTDDIDMNSACDIIRKNTKYILDAEPYIFVHAGVRPGVPLVKQKIDDLLWIRDEFFIHNENDKILPDVENAVIIHGHTIFRKPKIRKNRIGIDTGAFCHQVLTIIEIDVETGNKKFHSVTENGVENDKKY